MLWLEISQDIFISDSFWVKKIHMWPGKVVPSYYVLQHQPFSLFLRKRKCYVNTVKGVQ